MDQSSKKEADILQKLNILKNPNLTITLVNIDQTKTASTSKETKKNSKRTSSDPISDRSTKDAKYSFAKPITKRENNLCTISSKPNPVGSHELKKSNVIGSSVHVDTSISSKSYFEVQANDGSKTTTEENQICSCRWLDRCPRCNYKTKKPVDQKFSMYSIGDGEFSIDEIYKTPIGVYDGKDEVYIQVDDVIYKSTNLHLSQLLSQVIHKKLEKLLDDKELILKQKYKALENLTFDSSCESKNVASTSSNLRPVNHNITSNSKQSNDVCKLKRQKINQPSKQTIEPPNIFTQKSTSSNRSSKLKQSTNKKSVQKHHTSNNQHTNTSLKHSIATVTHSQTSNKHKITGYQLPKSSKHSMIVPTSKKHVNLLASMKSTIAYESVKGVVSETDVCKGFLYPSLKNVTVTRIQTPGGSPAIFSPESPPDTWRPIDSSECSSKTINSYFTDLSASQEEDEIPCSLAPVIISSNEKLNIEKLKKKDTDNMVKELDNVIILSDFINGKLFTIRRCDYTLLSSGQFLNDKLIQFYLDYWYSYQLSDEDRNRSYVFDNHFYNELTAPIKSFEVGIALSPSAIRFNRIKNFTKKLNVNIFQKDFIFIPIYENNHWFMAVLCFPHLSGKVEMKNGTPLQIPDEQPNTQYKQQQCDFINPERNEADPNIENLWLFDSNTTQNYFEKQGLSYAEDVSNLKKKKHKLVKQPCIIIFDSLSGGVHRARVTATLRDWLKHECITYNIRSLDFSPKSMIGALVKVPQQLNYTESGLFLLHYFEMFFKRPIVDYSFPIKHLENWFSVNDVSTGCKKRKEIKELILTRMDELQFKLPPRIKLPQLHFTVPLREHISPYKISDDECIVVLDDELNELYDEEKNVTECF